MAGESASDAARRMREKSKRLARSAELWDQGAEGERVTAGVLSGLPSTEWTVFHDIPWPGRPRANVDHVAVGPAGVFVIDSKNWSGAVKVVDQVLRQNGRSRDKTVAAAAEAALAIAGSTEAVGAEHFHPVLCFVRDEPIVGRARDVALCSTANLVEFLLTRPRVLDAPTVRRLCLDLDTAASAARDAATGSKARRSVTGKGASGRSRPASRDSSSNSRRASGPGARLVAGLAAAVTAIVLALSPLPRLFGDWMVDIVAGEGTSPSAADGADVVDPNPSLRPLLGTWTGQYRCGSGRTPGRLRVSRGSSPDEVRAVFDFQSREAAPSEPDGSFRMVGAVTEGTVAFQATAWITRPTGYQFVGFAAPLPRQGAARLAGDVTGTTNCTTFSFDRSE